MIKFLGESDVIGILLDSGYEYLIDTTRTTQLLNEHITKILPNIIKTVNYEKLNFDGFEYISWNDISAMGLLETINNEIMHPKGFAVFRDPKTGLSGGALVAQDGIFTY